MWWRAAHGPVDAQVFGFRRNAALGAGEVVDAKAKDRILLDVTKSALDERPPSVEGRVIVVFLRLHDGLHLRPVTRRRGKHQGEHRRCQQADATSRRNAIDEEQGGCRRGHEAQKSTARTGAGHGRCDAEEQQQHRPSLPSAHDDEKEQCQRHARKHHHADVVRVVGVHVIQAGDVAAAALREAEHEQREVRQNPARDDVGPDVRIQVTDVPDAQCDQKHVRHRFHE